MSEFNIYARKLDTAFKEARSEYNTAFRALQEAQQANRDANAWKPGDSAEEKQVRTTRAALKLHDAEAIFNESCKQKSIAKKKKVPQNLRDRKRA